MQIDFNDQQQALGFVMPQFYNIEAQVYARKYPSYDYASIIPVITEGSEWARGTLFRSSDVVGEAKFISGRANDMPYADVTRAQHLQGFEMAGIGFDWTLDELQVAALEGRNIGTEKADGARKVAEQLLWRTAMSGNTNLGWTGLINDGNVTATNAPNDGTGSARTFASKTPDQVLRDINDMIVGITTDTLETELADTVLLPTTIFQTLAARRMGDTIMTVLEFVRQNNAYTAQTNTPLTIRALRTLEAAGASSTKRAIAYVRDPQVLRFHLPMPHRFLAPFQKSSMSWEVAGIMRTGGTEIRLPKAVRYLDAI